MSVTKKPCTAYWIEPNGGLCPNAPDNKVGLPIGAHTCAHIDTYSEHEQQVHPKCECRCGATHKKPVAQLMIDRHEARQRRASVSVDEKGRGRVVVGQADISSHVGGGTIEFKAGELTRLKVSMWRVLATARGEIELDEETAKALEALGWSGPDTELLRRRDLQDALGGLGVVPREWDALLDWVRSCVTNFDELQAQLREVLGRESGSVVEMIQDVALLVERDRSLDK